LARRESVDVSPTISKDLRDAARRKHVLHNGFELHANRQFRTGERVTLTALATATGVNRVTKLIS
jgi:hypothetical protein